PRTSFCAEHGAAPRCLRLSPTRRSSDLQSAEARVTARDAGRVTLSVTLTDTMPSPSAVRPGSRQIQALDASIEGTVTLEAGHLLDRKSTRLNSSHVKISYAVFCLKKKKK